MDFIGIGLLLIGAFIAFAILAGLLLLFRLATRGAKAAEGGAEGIIHAVGDELHGLAGEVGPTFHRAATHGQKIGQAIDATDSLGLLLTSGGFMQAADWQPIADKITAAVAAYKPAPVTAEVVK